MKRTKYFITVRRDGKTQAELVNGYYDFVDGLAVGAHKTGEKSWTVSELSTGLAIVSSSTRKDAFDKFLSMTGTVHKALKDTDYAAIKAIINNAYAAM